jgi:ribosomal-protein-alanine N-acetyltransferase
MNALTIRKIGGNDEVERCAQMMTGSEPWLTLGRGYQAGLAMLKKTDRERYVALVGDDIAGFIVINMAGALVGYVQTICVAPEYRNNGLGARLMTFAEERIFHDTPNIFLLVSDFNPVARHFYQRLGYQVIGDIPDFLIGGHSEVLMRKTRGAIRGYRTTADGSV